MIVAIESAIVISMFFNFYCWTHSAVPLWMCHLCSVSVLFFVLVAEHYHYKLKNRIKKLEKDVEIMKGDKK